MLNLNNLNTTLVPQPIVQFDCKRRNYICKSCAHFNSFTVTQI